MPAIPPGGVGWPFYFLVPAIPASAAMASRYPGPRWIVLVYALIASSWFAMGVTFTDSDWQIGWARPDTGTYRLLKFGLIVTLLVIATVAAWTTARQWSARNSAKATHLTFSSSAKPSRAHVAEGNEPPPK